MQYKNIYAIGDVQGCFAELQALLELIQFNDKTDQLWFTGDVVNRGPQSLEVLRFIYHLGDHAITVLGNHDLHLLAIATGARKPSSYDTIDTILQAPDREELLAWLQHCPLLYHHVDYTIVHAGIPPQWSLSQAQSLAKEVEPALQKNAIEFFKNIYGNNPDTWSDDLSGWERLRYITNALTRMRFCSASGKLNLTIKDTAISNNPELLPWFAIEERKTAHDKILFGHWSALKGETHTPNTIALDTGCAWGNKLTAMKLSDHKQFSVEAKNNVIPAKAGIQEM